MPPGIRCFRLPTTREDGPERKSARRNYRRGLNWPVCVSSHVLGVVSRMYPQKGFDLLAQAFPALLDQFPLQLIVLGTGDVQVERLFENLAARLPRNVGVSLSFDESLAPLIFAGADTLVMPSRFEPCGLSQMYAMAFGTPPILRATGGLADSVISYFDDPQAATGFAFEDPTPKALADILVRALNLYFGQPREFRRLQRNGMMRDSSWKSSAALYEDIYRWAIEARGAPHFRLIEPSIFFAGSNPAMGSLRNALLLLSSGSVPLPSTPWYRFLGRRRRLRKRRTRHSCHQRPTSEHNSQ